VGVFVVPVARRERPWFSFGGLQGRLMGSTAVRFFDANVFGPSYPERGRCAPSPDLPRPRKSTAKPTDGIRKRKREIRGLMAVAVTAHIPPGRDGLFNLIRSTPATLKYEPGVIVAEDDYVIVHGRFSGTGRPRNWIAADVVRVTDGVLAEHWDVLQDEATEAESQSGLPMFGTKFPG
jgi:hypothetical protein